MKDTSIMLTPSHIKSFILMTLQGLEYLHLNWILHRVSRVLIRVKKLIIRNASSQSEAITSPSDKAPSRHGAPRDGTNSVGDLLHPGIWTKHS